MMRLKRGSGGVAEYECQLCGVVYTSDPGPTTCPYCEHEYVKWLNYDELAESGIFKEKKRSTCRNQKKRRSRQKKKSKR
jgi:uncharacterized Zn finger protein (UPF0148 family)